MVRPEKCRCVCCRPVCTCFSPKSKNKGVVDLKIEEFESIRLADLRHMPQDKAAKSMKTSQSTFQRILSSGRTKIAQALVEGKEIKINGGCYEYEQ